ncbi:MAG: FkbM family methyltransferase, partial [Balneolaceae bacterium]
MQSRILQAQKVLNQKKSNPNRAVQLLTPVVQDELTPWQAYHLYGQAMLKKKEYSKAMDYLKRALYMGSEDVGTYYSLSLAAYHLKRFKESELYAEKAVKVREDHFEAWMKLGDSKKELGKLNEALGSFQKCNQIDPKKAEVAVKIGHIYRDQGYSDKAIEMYEIAIKMDRGQLNAINEKVKILTNQKRFDEALKSIESGLGIQPDNIVLQVTCAELKKEMGEYAQAIKIYEGILKKKPNYGGVRVNYANILQELGRFDEAERNYLRANKDFPALMESFSNYLFVQHYNPSKTKEEIFEAHKKWDSIYAPDHPERAEPVDQDRDRPLRIGLISGGFRKHPVGWMILPGLEKIDRDQYELYFYSNYSLVDEVTKKLHSISHKWHMVKALDDEKLNKLIREDQIDILIDLSGHAAESRLRTVAMEPAPVIVKWVGGLINTTGLKSIDFLLSDSIETPDGVEPFYLEKLVRMPDDYICYRAPEYAPEVGENPFKMNGFITFGCFNNPIKVNPELLGVWAEIMKKVPNSKLFLKSKQYGNKVYVERIQTIMDKYGIEPERLIFEGLSPHAELLQTYNRIDIALDPWPYSGGLTTCEAMWMGIPVITKPGDTFAGRHSATHVFNAGFKEWICNNWDEYIHQSVLLASDPVTLSDLRKGLRDRVASSPLCDSDRYAAHLEKAFRQMWYQRIDGYEKGLNKDEWSDHIRVEPIKESTSDSNKIGKSISESPTNRYRFDRNGDLSTEPVDSSISRLKVNHSNHNGKILADHETLSQFKTDDGITICTPDDHTLLTRYVLEEQKNWYEAELSFIKNFVKPGMTILDIGAGFGVYTLPIAKKIGNSGSVYSFEPSPMLNRYLEKSIKINGFNQIELINLAVTDQVGKQQFEADSQNPENGQLNPEGEVEVMTTTLDAWWQLNGLPNIDLIKIDVNGMELNVLKGAENLLSKNSPFLLIAVPNSKDQMDAIIKYLNSIDYELYQYISQLRLLARYEIEQEKDVYLNNLVAVKKDLVPSLIDQGLIFDDVVEIGKPASDTWMKVFNRFKWSSDKISAWETALNKTDAVYYKRALNYIATALELNIETDHKNRSAKAKYLLGAAQLMIELYNGGLDQNISISLSLSRVLNDLGRRGQAVSVLKNVIDQQQKNGKSSNEVNLPFYLPIHSQDDSEIKTDFDKWLMVRIVEAWLLLKDQSSYFSGDTEHRMLQLLDGNPETG